MPRNVLPLIFIFPHVILSWWPLPKLELPKLELPKLPFLPKLPSIPKLPHFIPLDNDAAEGHKKTVESKNEDTVGYTFLSFALSQACYHDVPTNDFQPLTSKVEDEFKKECQNVEDFEFITYDNQSTEVHLYKHKTKKLAIFAFRGTDDADDVIKKQWSFLNQAADIWSKWEKKENNKNEVEIEFPAGGGEHPSVYGGAVLGFSNIEQWFAKHLRMLEENGDYEVLMTGHSLGGVYAYMAALYAAQILPKAASKIKVITYGSPKFGNLKWKELYENTLGCAHTIGYFNENDVISKLPPVYDFSRPCYRKEDQLGRQVKDHILKPACELVSKIPIIGNLLSPCTPFNELLLLGHVGTIYEKSLDDNFRAGTEIGHVPDRLCKPSKRFWREKRRERRREVKRLRREKRRQKRREEEEKNNTVSSII